MVKHVSYTIHIERYEDGIYVVSVPALPGCFTQGHTLDEAFCMAQDAIHAFLIVFIRRGKKLSQGKGAEKVSPFLALSDRNSHTFSMVPC